MDPSLYEKFAQVEDRHWWFRGRRAILARALRQHLPPRPAQAILEVGCGTGGNLPLLAQFGAVRACEMDPMARTLAARKSGLTVVDGSLPDAFPFPGERFDAIVAADVLEHVEAEGAALEVMRRHLAPDGRLILTVPALPAMWSHHDVLNHHFRRYTRPGLRESLAQAGFETLACSYFNTWLLPVAWAVRRFARPARDDLPGIELELPKAPLNALLYGVFRTEAPFIRAGLFPFGLSLLAVARAARPDQDQDLVRRA